MPIRLLLTALVTATFLPAAVTAQAVTVTNQMIDARANIYAAGLSAVPSLPFGGGVLPPGVSFTAQPGRVLTFSSVTGVVSCYSGPPFTASPDGDVVCAGSTNINSYNNLSATVASGRSFFLAGVFLGPNVPAAPAPAALDFGPGAGQTDYDFTSLAPTIGQVFFIGDGLTGSGIGTVQQFLVPRAATRLYLGFADAANFSGDPGYYNDNRGSLTARLEISAVPEPSTGWLLGSTLVLVLGLARRRSMRR